MAVTFYRCQGVFPGCQQLLPWCLEDFLRVAGIVSWPSGRLGAFLGCLISVPLFQGASPVDMELFLVTCYFLVCVSKLFLCAKDCLLGSREELLVAGDHLLGVSKSLLERRSFPGCRYWPYDLPNKGGWELFLYEGSSDGNSRRNCKLFH